MSPLFLHPLLLLLITTLTSALPLHPATNALLTDISALDHAIRAATNAIAAYPGGTQPYEPLRAANAQLIRRNRIAYNDALTLPPQSIDTSTQIIDQVASPILPDIDAYVAALLRQHDLIAAAGLERETATTLEVVASDHDTLSLAVGARLSPVTLGCAVPAARARGRWAVEAGGAGVWGVPLAPLVVPVDG
ncbi:Hydrophobic surface binding protein A [Teratosphaeria destructans]|uniref:Hydrophobic surface binding protein A n=1 Tax=Teratosphaeria destructans TaxID=418781 RepID=A0A9W7W2L5_9PEZI|nr:Hydrophobic surface binding protein A [Teratosphaeria destructans]